MMDMGNALANLDPLDLDDLPLQVALLTSEVLVARQEIVKVKAALAVLMREIDPCP